VGLWSLNLYPRETLSVTWLQKSQSAAAPTDTSADCTVITDNVESTFEDPFEGFDLFSLEKDNDQDFAVWIDV
jgi:hypothetical protein